MNGLGTWGHLPHITVKQYQECARENSCILGDLQAHFQERYKFPLEPELKRMFRNKVVSLHVDYLFLDYLFLSVFCLWPFLRSHFLMFILTAILRGWDNFLNPGTFFFKEHFFLQFIFLLSYFFIISHTKKSNTFKTA